MKTKLITLGVLLLSSSVAFAPHGAARHKKKGHRSYKPSSAKPKAVAPDTVIYIREFLQKVAGLSWSGKQLHPALLTKLSNTDSLPFDQLKRTVNGTLKEISTNRHVRNGGSNDAHNKQLTAVMALAAQ